MFKKGSMGTQAAEAYTRAEFVFQWRTIRVSSNSRMWDSLDVYRCDAMIRLYLKARHTQDT